MSALISSPVPGAGPIGKAMLVLDCITSRTAPVRLSDIARQTGLAKSTVHRLLAELESHQAVRQATTGYVPGEAIRRFSQGFQGRQHDTLRRLLTPHLAELHARTRLITSLAVLDGTTAVFVETIYPRRFADTAVQAPDRVPARQTAAGRLLLAYGAPRPPARPDARGRESELEHLRRDGATARPEEHLTDLVGIAAAVGDRAKPTAAISLAGPPGDAGPVRFLPLLRWAAHEASLTLRLYPRME
jgi:DNA-binding IclR family transcriptional regulator